MYWLIAYLIVGVFIANMTYDFEDKKLIRGEFWWLAILIWPAIIFKMVDALLRGRAKFYWRNSRKDDQ